MTTSTTDMEIETEIYEYFSQISKTSESINQLSIYLNFADTSEESLKFLEAFEDLLTKHRDSITSVMDLFVAYKKIKLMS
jgi:hypothetical protein